MSKYIAHYGVKGMKWKNKKNTSDNNDVEVNEIQIHHAPGSKPTTGMTKIKEFASNKKKQALINKKIKKRRAYLIEIAKKKNSNEITNDEYKKKTKTIKNAIKELRESINL
jgi:hypothetical protein